MKFSLNFTQNDDYNNSEKLMGHKMLSYKIILMLRYNIISK